MNDTWIKLYRALLDKPIWKKSTAQQRSVLIAILLMANHRENEWEWKGQKFKVNPGQFVTSLESIRKKAGQDISIQNVRSSLARFKKLQFLTYKSTKSGRLITVINWDRYQPKREQGQQSTQQRGNKGATTNKNDKNDKSKKKNIKKKKFTPPKLQDVIQFFIDNGYTEESAEKAFLYYSDAEPPWTDSTGKKVRGWKQKMRGVWFKSDNKQKSGVDIQPKTYAQAQDLERRGRAKWLKKEMGNDNQESSNQGTDKTIPLLPSDTV